MKRKKKGYAKYGYLFALPFVIAYLIFSFYPTIYTAVIGFTNVQGLFPPELKILDDPLANFKATLTSSIFQKALATTFKLWIWNFIPQMFLALLLTAWFTDRRCKIKGQGFFKVIFYMPNIITAATVAILFASMFGYPVGPVNSILKSLHIIKKPVYFMNEKFDTQAIVAFIQFWMWYGYTMIVLISGVLGISPEIFEAAEVDGANRWQTFFRITIPNLKSILLFSLVTSLIGGLNMFDIPHLLNNHGPDNATNTTSTFIYGQAFNGAYLYNKAAAASVIMFLIIVFFSALLFFLMRDKDAAKEAKQIKKQDKIRMAQMKAAAKEGK